MSDPRKVSARSDGAPWLTELCDGRHHWLADTGQANGGAYAAPDPEDLVLGGLGACTAITLRMYAARKHWPLEDVQVELSLEMSSAGGGNIVRKIHLQGNLDEAQRQRLLAIAEKCPVHRLLTGEVRIHSDLST